MVQKRFIAKAKIECYRCLEMLDDGKSLKEVLIDHEDCHGWTHCEIDCCGPCPFCGWCDMGEDEDEDEDYSEEGPDHWRDKELMEDDGVDYKSDYKVDVEEYILSKNR
jgi:hypothetical protein